MAKREPAPPQAIDLENEDNDIPEGATPGKGRLGPDLEVEAYFKECVEITPDLDEDMRRVSADFAYWGERFWQGLEAHLKLKAEYERAEALAYIEERERLLDIDGKATEAQVKAAVSKRPELFKMKLRVLGAEAQKAKFKHRAEAVAMKKDMLQSLGAKVRKEMENDPVLRSLYAKEAEARRQREASDDDYEG